MAACGWWWWWWWIIFVVWLTDERHLAWFPAGTIVRDSYHRKSPIRREQDLNLRRNWVRALLKLCSCDNHYTTAPYRVLWGWLKRWANIATKLLQTFGINRDGDFNRYFTEAAHRSVLRKMRSKNIQQIYRRTPMPKCHFNKVA